MAAYIVIDRLLVRDPEAFEPYQRLASAAIESHAGRYVLPHQMLIEGLEGNWRPHRIVLIAFADAEQARQWWRSTEYARARAIHRQATISNTILVEGTVD